MFIRKLLLLILSTGLTNLAFGKESAAEEKQTGRILVEMESADPNQKWIALAHEKNIYNILSGHERIIPVDKSQTEISKCSDDPCRFDELVKNDIDIYVQGNGRFCG